MLPSVKDLYYNVTCFMAQLKRSWQHWHSCIEGYFSQNKLCCSQKKSLRRAAIWFYFNLYLLIFEKTIAVHCRGPALNQLHDHWLFLAHTLCCYCLTTRITHVCRWGRCSSTARCSGTRCRRLRAGCTPCRRCSGPGSRTRGSTRRRRPVR